MSGQQAAAEPYTTRFETEVTAVDGREVWLETSYFFAATGGQPADRGRIGDVSVESVRLDDGDPVHVLAEEPRFGAGHRVLCSIDWEFRMYCMRAHTAGHVLYGAARRHLSELAPRGFAIDESAVAVDLETATTVDDDVLLELDEAINRVVWESRPVTWESVPAAEARERTDVAFTEDAESEAFSRGRLRLVTIGGVNDNGHGDPVDPWDVAACGGTHVRNTREIGPVTVFGRTDVSENVTRIELAVGPAAIDRQSVEKRTALSAGAHLETAVENVPAALERALGDHPSVTDQLRRRERDLVAARIDAGVTVTRNGNPWRIATVGDLPNEVAATVVQSCMSGSSSPLELEIDAVTPGSGGRTGVDGTDDPAVLVVIGEQEVPYAVVGTDGSVDASSVLDSLLDRFGGSGGGSARLAQGGAFDATPADLAAHFDRSDAARVDR